MSKKLKKICIILLLFFAIQCVDQNSILYDHGKIDDIKYFDVQAHKIYPVSLSDNQVRCIVVPHDVQEQAHCLMVATYKSLQEQKFDTIIVMCQADEVLFHGVALPIATSNIFSHDLHIAYDHIEQLSKSYLFHYYQMPFCTSCVMRQQLECINFYLKNVQIIPLIIGHLSPEDASNVALILADCITEHTLIIMSTNIAHYKNCVHNCIVDASKVCTIYDEDSCRIQALQSHVQDSVVHIFHDQSISSIFSIFFEFLRLPVLKKIESLFVGYATSCNDSCKMEDITSYGAFIMQDSLSTSCNRFGHYEQSQLLQCARVGLHDFFCLSHGRLPCMISYNMLQLHGVFVSLYKMSDHGPLLQGCMGTLQASLPLYKMVYQISQQTACKDIRFYALQEQDLASTIISLAVVQDFKKIDKYDEICSCDGLILQCQDKQAIAMPNYKVLDTWNYESILIELSRQIGNYDFLWKKPQAQIITFRTIEFKEE